MRHCAEVKNLKMGSNKRWWIWSMGLIDVYMNFYWTWCLIVLKWFLSKEKLNDLELLEYYNCWCCSPKVPDLRKGRTFLTGGSDLLEPCLRNHSSWSKCNQWPMCKPSDTWFHLGRDWECPIVQVLQLFPCSLQVDGFVPEKCYIAFKKTQSIIRGII